MTLRALYNYVVRTITEACREANQERCESTRRNRSHSVTMSHLMAFSEGAGDSESRNIDGDGPSGGGIDIIEEEKVENNNNCNNNNGSPNPTTPSSPYPPTTTPHAPSNVPPHLPSLTSSTNATPPLTESNNNANNHHRNNDESSRDTGIISPNDELNQQSYQQQQHTQQHNTHHHPPQRAAQTAFTPLPNNATHRERLGGYLHPRDMRRLVTPFSSSNEPQLMVRRHVMLLNFDPLRAVVLKDRLLVLVPDGADSILIELERRVQGGIVEMENQVFGTSLHDAVAAGGTAPPIIKRNKSYEQFAKLTNRESNNPKNHQETTDHSVSNTEQTTEHTTQTHDEWEDIQKMDWAHLPFELQSVDAVLQTVTSMLMDDARKVHHKAVSAMSELRGDSPKKTASGLGEHAQERLKMHKDEVALMEGRVQGFVRAMNETLDDDEDMTLMNLSRLLTHPERFVQPVSQEILHEESDEPELILEAYLQQALSIVNELELLKGQIMTTEEQISMTLDAIRNRLLYINALLSVASLCVALGSFVGSIFGMNLTNHIEYNDTAFVRVTVGVIVGMVSMWAMLSWVFFHVANIHSNIGKKTI